MHVRIVEAAGLCRLGEGPLWSDREQALYWVDILGHTVHTDQPAIQLYTGNFLDSPKHAALCLETQHVPNAPNRAEFASTVLRPGAVFRSTTVYRFSG